MKKVHNNKLLYPNHTNDSSKESLCELLHEIYLLFTKKISFYEDKLKKLFDMILNCFRK